MIHNGQMDRYLKSSVKADLVKKIVLLTGPRQVGKTTFSKSLTTRFDYLNYDSATDRVAISQGAWDRTKELLILDEVHKMPKWKAWLKGVFDTEGLKPKIIVTGSARLDVAKKMGDSLAGRHFTYSLMPLDLKELKRLGQKPEACFETLDRVGGFPEPFLDGSERFYGKWKRTHLDLILRQDLIDLESVRDIVSIETLIELLKTRVGSTVSFASLGRDLQKDPKTVRHWLEVLENLFVVFKVAPYHKNVARSLLKDSKYYFYDVAQVSDEAMRLENHVALSLKKEVLRLGDEEGIEMRLHFLQDKDRHEVDFVVLKKAAPALMVEVKKSDAVPSPHFVKFRKYLGEVPALQLVLDLKREFSLPNGIRVRRLIDGLAELDL